MNIPMSNSFLSPHISFLLNCIPNRSIVKTTSLHAIFVTQHIISLKLHAKSEHWNDKLTTSKAVSLIDDACFAVNKFTNMGNILFRYALAYDHIQASCPAFCKPNLSLHTFLSHSQRLCTIHDKILKHWESLTNFTNTMSKCSTLVECLQGGMLKNVWHFLLQCNKSK